MFVWDYCAWFGALILIMGYLRTDPMLVVAKQENIGKVNKIRCWHSGIAMILALVGVIGNSTKLFS